MSMFGNMKDAYAMKKMADTMKKLLRAAKIIISAEDGKIKAEINGDISEATVTISPDLITDEKTRTTLEKAFSRIMIKGMKATQDKGAEIMKTNGMDFGGLGGGA